MKTFFSHFYVQLMFPRPDDRVESYVSCLTACRSKCYAAEKGSLARECWADDGDWVKSPRSSPESVVCVFAEGEKNVGQQLITKI